MGLQVPLVQLLVAALAASILGEIVMGRASRRLWEKFYEIDEVRAKALFGEQSGTRQKARIFTNIKGCLERIIYACAPIMGVPEGIALVLALNGISQLKLWSGESTEDAPLDKGADAAMGRAAFNIWLSLHLLNVILGVGIALVVMQLIS